MHGVGPGSVLAGRYTATLRMSSSALHERWRATDSTLERDVVLTCFRADSEVAAPALDAARRAAAVEDHRLVRILDVGTDLGVSFIVEEPLTGAAPLSHLLQSGGLPANEARRLTGEAATALEKARHRGLHHLALTPSCILRMPDGEVKVRGLATEAALTDADDAADAEASQIDAVGLVKIAYACLTARWPHAASEAGKPPQDVGLEPAPSIIGGVAAPSEIAVGVPADLDLICRLALGENGTGPTSPGDLAVQIAPWPSEPPISDGGSGIDVASARSSGPGSHRGPSSTRVLPPVSGDAASAARPSDPARSLAAAGAGSGTGEATSGGQPSGAGLIAGAAAAGTAAVGVAGAIGDKVGSFARAAADRAASKAAERRAAHEERIVGEDLTLTDALEDAAPQELEPPLPLLGNAAPQRPSNTQSRIALAIVSALVLVALVIGVQNVLRIGQTDASEARPTATVTASKPTPSGATTSAPAKPAKKAPAAVPITITGGTGLDLQDGTEADQNVKLVHDGNPGTMWRSRWYATSDFNGKGGLGVELDLKPSDAVVREVKLTLPVAQDVTVYTANSADPAKGQELGKTSGRSGTISLKAPKDLKPASKLLVWVTKGAPAEADNRFRAQISEVSVS